MMPSFGVGGLTISLPMSHGGYHPLKDTKQLFANRHSPELADVADKVYSGTCLPGIEGFPLSLVFHKKSLRQGFRER